MSTEKEAPEEEVPEKGIALLHSKGSYWLPHNPNADTCRGCAFGWRKIYEYLEEIGVRFLKEKHPVDPTLRKVELPKNARLTISEAYGEARLLAGLDPRVLKISYCASLFFTETLWHAHLDSREVNYPRDRAEATSTTPETALAA